MAVLTTLASRSWNNETAAHLLNRAGFGGTPEEVEALRKLGLEASVHRLVDETGDAANVPPPACLVRSAHIPRPVHRSIPFAQQPLRPMSCTAANRDAAVGAAVFVEELKCFLPSSFSLSKMVWLLWMRSPNHISLEQPPIPYAGTVTVFESSVTAPIRANARPSSVARCVSVID